MKFRATFSSVGVQWLERFVPVFDKLGKELSVLLTPNTLHLVQDAVASGGLELHADPTTRTRSRSRSSPRRCTACCAV
jgi:HUS1 checkpoint protein